MVLFCLLVGWVYLFCFLVFFLFCLYWVFIPVCGISLAVVAGASLCYGAQVLGAWASVVVARKLSSSSFQALEYRLHTYGA